jgi:predicted PurR-regulated permease PerM
MINKSFLTQSTYFLLFTILSAFLLIEAQDVFLPLTFSTIFAFIVLPLSNSLEKRRFPRWLSALVSVVLIAILVGFLVAILSYQIAQFADDMPMLKGKLNEKIFDLQQYIRKQWGYTVTEQNKWIDKQKDANDDQAGSFLMFFFSATTGFIANLTLIPIIIFFMLLYRHRFKTFFSLLDNQYQLRTLHITKEIGLVSQLYLKGLFLDVAILAVLNSIGFLFLGVEHAILFGLIAAILNIIPYIGVIIGGLFPMLMVFVTQDNSWIVLGVFGVTVIVQFLDNNFIYPKVVGSSVSINPLMSIIALIVGNLIWGTSGMILALPIVGMLKVIMDNIEHLRPLGYLMGEEDELKYEPQNINMENSGTSDAPGSAADA